METLIIIALSVVIIHYIIIKSKLFTENTDSINILKISIISLSIFWTIMIISDYIEEYKSFQNSSIIQLCSIITFVIADIILIVKYIKNNTKKNIIIYTILTVFYNTILTAIITLLIMGNRWPIKQKTGDIVSGFWLNGLEYTTYGVISTSMIGIINVIIMIILFIVKIVHRNKNNKNANK